MIHALCLEQNIMIEQLDYLSFFLSFQKLKKKYLLKAAEDSVLRGKITNFNRILIKNKLFGKCFPRTPKNLICLLFSLEKYLETDVKYSEWRKTIIIDKVTYAIKRVNEQTLVCEVENK